MKPAAWAILILSVLLLLAVGWIIYSTIRGDEAMKQAQTEISEAEAKAEKSEAERLKAEADNVRINTLNEKLNSENASQAATIISSSRTIAAMKAEKKALHDISAVAVDQGAELDEVHAAGSVIVDAVPVPALREWYELEGEKITPLLISLDDFDARIGLLDLRIVELEAQNTELLAGNRRIQDLIDEQKTTIADQRLSIDEQGLAIAGLRGDLEAASTDIQSAMNRAQLGEFLAWGFGILSLGEAAYIAGNIIGWW